MAVAPTTTDRRFYALNGLLSVGALGVIAWILMGRSGHAPSSSASGLAFMPALNATLNGISAAFLCAGWLAIRSGRPRLHRALMVSAFLASTLFLLGYLAYHWVQGDTPYPGHGTARVIYLTILASHVLLSMLVLPLVLTAFYLAFTSRFPLHKRLARVTLPIWLYVSITGVGIFLMLRAAHAG